MQKIVSWLHSRFFRFVLISILGGTADLGVYFGLNHFLDIHYMVAGFFAFSAAIVSNFFLAKRWAFRCDSARVNKQFRSYFLVGLGGLILHQIILMLGMSHAMNGEILIKLLASWATVIWSYSINKRVTFRS
jgi:putative flippase GtrA